MPAIADSDDLYAWLVRGFVESGMPDHTRGGREWIATGALNLENLRAGGAGTILLEFRGQAGDSPVPDDDYTYEVCVVRSPEGNQVDVRSEDALFHHAFSWGGGGAPRNAPPGAADALALAGHILHELRAHNTRFTEWRAQGGASTLSQRRGIPSTRGAPPDRALLTVLETLARTNRSVTEGPAHAWGVRATVVGPSSKIVAGLGLEPQYVTRKAMVTLSFEDIEHAERLRFAGTLLLVSAGLSLLVLLGLTLTTGWNLYSMGFRWLAAQGWVTVFSLVGTGLFATVHGFAGLQLRALRRRNVVGGLAILGMLPCLGPCCGVGFPLGAWVLYLLRDERTTRVFNG